MRGNGVSSERNTVVIEERVGLTRSWEVSRAVMKRNRLKLAAIGLIGGRAYD